jgi:hypothetical protein
MSDKDLYKLADHYRARLARKDFQTVEGQELIAKLLEEEERVNKFIIQRLVKRSESEIG